MILVTGSGRSGTSAVAQMLHRAGIAVGRDLIEADEANAEGYFEERALIELNDRILRDAGLHQRFSTASRDDVLAAARLYRDEMHMLASQATLAWKDPRFCWTLEAWLDVLAAPPRLVVCLRSPREVAASTMRYYGLVGREDARALEHAWRAQYERLLEVIDAHRLESLCIEYARLQARPRVVAVALSRFVSHTIDAASVRPDLRHHQAAVPRRLVPLYRRVRSLGAQPQTRRPPRAGAAARRASAPSRS